MTADPTPPRTAPDGRPESPEAADRLEEKVRRAYSWYRLMAYVTGGMLVLLTVEMVLKYVFNGGEPVIGTWVAIVHGWIYVLYAVTVFNLWSLMRWSFGRIVLLIAGGVVPVLSFVMERRAHRWVTEDLPRLRARLS